MWDIFQWQWNVCCRGWLMASSSFSLPWDGNGKIQYVQLFSWSYITPIGRLSSGQAHLLSRGYCILIYSILMPFSPFWYLLFQMQMSRINSWAHHPEFYQHRIRSRWETLLIQDSVWQNRPSLPVISKLKNGNSEQQMSIALFKMNFVGLTLFMRSLFSDFFKFSLEWTFERVAPLSWDVKHRDHI